MGWDTLYVDVDVVCIYLEMSRNRSSLHCKEEIDPDQLLKEHIDNKI